MFDHVVFIGRVNPYHDAHHGIVSRALSLGREVYILLGSAKRCRSIRNPFTVEERTQMIRGCFSEEENQRIQIKGLRDYPYDDASWVKQVKESVPEGRTGIIGHKKDATSSYLNWFEDWESIEHKFEAGYAATEVRHEFFLYGDRFRELSRATLWIQPSVSDWLTSFAENNQDTFNRLAEEWNKFKQLEIRLYPNIYPRIEHCVDSLVTWGDYVLLVKRGRAPGKGCYALPGGHLDLEETEFEGAVRELKEETKIEGCGDIRWHYTGYSQTFDYPWRSVMGRVITRAFHFDIPVGAYHPLVKGSDDAEEALWVSKGDISSLEEFFHDDHYDILRHFLGDRVCP